MAHDDGETKAAKWVQPAEVESLSIHPSMRRRITDGNPVEKHGGRLISRLSR